MNRRASRVLAPKNLPNNRKTVRPSKRKTMDDSSDHVDEKFYIIERIVKYKAVRGRRYALIKWKGYPDSDSTWEPAESIVDLAHVWNACSEPVNDFTSYVAETAMYGIGRFEDTASYSGNVPQDLYPVTNILDDTDDAHPTRDSEEPRCMPQRAEESEVDFSSEGWSNGACCVVLTPMERALKLVPVSEEQRVPHWFSNFESVDVAPEL